MRFRPILFNTEMVKAIRDGRKTKHIEIARKLNDHVLQEIRFFGNEPDMKPAPFIKREVLWVQEKWTHPSYSEILHGASPKNFLYQADSAVRPDTFEKWKSADSMPKEAARLFIKIKNVTYQFLNELTSEDILALGFNCQKICPYRKSGEIAPCINGHCDNPKQWFPGVWNTEYVNRNELWHGAWSMDPIVWVFEFECCDKPRGWRAFLNE